MKIWSAARIFICICTLLYSLYGISTLFVFTNLSMYQWGFAANKVAERDKPYYIEQIKNLRSYLISNGSLNNNWTVKEHRHFSDVKKIFTGLVISTALTLIIFLALINRKISTKVFFYSFLTQVIILSLIYFFFHTLFIFLHTVLFNNMDWLDSDPKELSYRIFDDVQFFYYGIFIVGTSLLVNLIFLFFSKYKLKNH